MSKELLIKIAKNFVNNGFMEESLKKETNRYIEYKFNEIVYFSKITEIHFNIFRKYKNELFKLKAMTIIELIILASDIMDDIQDRDAKAAPWGKVDNTMNLNIIIGILIICLKEIEGTGIGIEKVWLEKAIFNPILKSISGQQIDLKNNLTSESEYIDMCSMKSGALVALACFLGAGKIDECFREEIEEYSKHLGVIFQLRNDVNDMKNGFIKNDILLRKRTLPIIYYLNTDDNISKRIQSYYLDCSSNLDPIKIHQDLMTGNALLYCSILEKIFCHRYKLMVNQLNLTVTSKNSLLDIIARQQERMN